MVTLREIFIILVVLSIVSKTSFASKYSNAIVESCQGCQLNRLPEVKSFIFEDVPKYENVRFKHIQGAPPELVLFENDQEKDRIKLEKLNRQQLNELLVESGFTTKSSNEKIDL